MSQENVYSASSSYWKPILFVAAPWVFVFLWSTGFVGAKFSLQYSGPFHLLFFRGLFSCVIFLFLSVVLKVKFPSLKSVKQQLIVGLFLQTFFLGGCFFAINKGLPASVVALITGLQPVLTAVLASIIQSKQLKKLQWLGIVVGFLGVFLVLSPTKIGGELSLIGLLAAFFGLTGVTVGAMYQKKAVSDGHIFASTFFQYIPLAVVMGVVSFLYEPNTPTWNAPFIISILWLVVGVSVTAILLLIFMIKNGESTKVASYFYLVPVLTAVEAWILFDEKISFAMLLGMGLSIIGLLLVHRK